MDLTVTYNHLEKLENLKLPTEFQNLEKCERNGRELYKTRSWLRDIATFMEHPESYHFYKTYLCNPERFKRVIVYLKLYDLITRHTDDKMNGYHKIFILYRLVNHSVYGPLLKRHLTTREITNALT